MKVYHLRKCVILVSWGPVSELDLNCFRIPCVRCLCLRSRLVTLNRKYPKNVYRNQAQGRSRVHQPVVPLPEKIPVMSPAFRNHWQHRPTPAATRNPEPIEPIPLGFDTNRIMWLCWVELKQPYHIIILKNNLLMQSCVPLASLQIWNQFSGTG